MDLTKHVNPPKSENWATAPYNFVPLPAKVLQAEAALDWSGWTGPPPWRAHDRWLPGTHSGWLDLRITTLTPLFIRGPARRTGDGWDTRDARERPEPWTAPDGRPVIPGSSLRGMLRNLVEIMAYAKITPVSQAKPFYRTVAPTRVGIAYRNRMLQSGRGLPRGGFVERREGGWFIRPTEVLRVGHQRLYRFGLPDLERCGPDYHPAWSLQQRRCWIRRDGTKVTALRPQGEGAERPAGAGWVPGTLVLTGKAPKKEAEFVFLDPTGADELVEIPQEVWDRFHDDDQITGWQEKAFPKNRPERQPEGTERRADGWLRPGEPVFYLRQGENGPVEFLGRARMFRLPYDYSMADLVPPSLREGGLDLAEAIFGRVAQGRDGLTVKGRVRVEDAVAVGDPPEGGWLEGEFIPKILSSPKPTAIAHYLTQDGGRSSKDLTTYLMNQETRERDITTIRGHKLYWHRWDERGLELVREVQGVQGDRKVQKGAGGREDRSVPLDTQHTRINPVRACVTFTGRVRFDNLTDVELGALLSAVRLPEGCAHKLGMGRPLGLGSVRVSATLHLIDRERRYRAWAADGAVDAEAVGEVERRCLASFADLVVRHAKEGGEPILEDRDGLARAARLDTLFLMLRWHGRPAVEDTRYLELKEHREQRVLPTPHAIVAPDRSEPDRSEPDWNRPPPKAAPPEQDPDQERRERRGGARSQSGDPPGGRDRRGRPGQGHGRPAQGRPQGRAQGRERPVAGRARPVPERGRSAPERRPRDVPPPTTRAEVVSNLAGHWMLRDLRDPRTVGSLAGDVPPGIAVGQELDVTIVNRDGLAEFHWVPPGQGGRDQPTGPGGGNGGGER